MKTTKAEQKKQSVRDSADQVMSITQLSELCKNQNQLWIRVKIAEVKHIGYTTCTIDGKKTFVTA